MNITINDDFCWICGKIKSKTCNLTMHHSLPKHLKPKKNIILPVCQSCHDKLNEEDLNGIYALGYKIHKSLSDMKKISRIFYKHTKSLSAKNSKGGYKENDRDIK